MAALNILFVLSYAGSGRNPFVPQRIKQLRLRKSLVFFNLQRGLMTTSFLTLPKDIQLYILGRVVYDYYIDVYYSNTGWPLSYRTKKYYIKRRMVCGYRTKEYYIKRMVCGTFELNRECSNMVNFLIPLSSVCKRVRQLLKEVTVKRPDTAWSTWSFNTKLFASSNAWQTLNT